MKRGLVAVVCVVAVAVFALRSRHHSTPAAVAILEDVAQSDGPGISWRVHEDVASTTLWQRDHAVVRGSSDKAFVATQSWQLELSLSKVASVMCHVTGGEHGYPEYGFISFLPE